MEILEHRNESENSYTVECINDGSDKMADYHEALSRVKNVASSVQDVIFKIEEFDAGGLFFIACYK